ncbi:hypothetical protein BLGI_3104 [Brevibacillus laterosporus GI-9]|nr:hypothetical protein BLGI_3104 [Brevibacillus laterosporus GI-9]
MVKFPYGVDVAILPKATGYDRTSLFPLNKYNFRLDMETWM